MRVRLKDADRQLINYQSYEIQIKELTENSHQIEMQNKDYQDELEKMSLACNNLYEELSSAKRDHEMEKEQMSQDYHR